jgi:phage shock protein PspC (stress-responsive transcriptional regulator)
VNGLSEPSLLRPRDGRLIAGVCAAVARRFGLDVNLVRGVWGAFCLLGVGCVLYLLLWLVIPQE